MLYEEISKTMVEAMKSHDKDTLSTIRLLKSAIDAYVINNKMDRNEVPSDEIVIDVVSKQVKTHKESIEEFKKGNRNDLVENLEREIKVLEKYLPAQLSEEEIGSIIDKTIEEVNATSMQDLGKLMKELTPKFKGVADMKTVSNIVRQKLS